MAIRKRTRSAGFSLIEMMVVVSVMATFAAFALPAYQRATARAKMFDAITALAAVGGRAEAACADTNVFPASLAGFGPAPVAYRPVALQGAATCDSFVLVAVPDDAHSELPKLCVRNSFMKLTFGANLGGAYTAADIPGEIAGNCGS